jgi:hypothetical protein
MSLNTPFAPSKLGNPATAGQTTAIVMSSGAPAASIATVSWPGYANAVMVTNSSSLAAFVALVTPPNNYTVTTKDTPVLANNRVILAAPSGQGSLVVGALSSGTLGANATVYFSPGIGGGSQS